MSLDWAMDGVHGQDPSLAILDVIEEEFHREKNDSTPKNQRQEEAVELAKLHQLWRCKRTF
jgi:hypothetical protein